MNILIIEDFASQKAGGAERTMFAFCEQISKEHNLYLIYSKYGDNAASKIFKEVFKLNLKPFTVTYSIFWLINILRLINFCKKANVNIVFTHLVHITPALRILKIFYTLKVGIFFKWILSTKSAGRQFEWGVKKLDFAAAVSNNVLNYWISCGVPKNIIRKIPDVEMYYKVENFEDSTANFNNIIGFAGRIVKEKGLGVLIQAVYNLNAKNLFPEVLVAGEFDNSDDYYQDILRLLDDYKIKRFNFLGYITPLHNFLEKIDLLIVPSITPDAQPTVLIQAMMMGKLVLASDIGGIPEILNGDLNVLLFKANDSNSLANKIESLIYLDEKERKSLRKRLYDRATAEYSFDNTYSQLKMLMDL